MGLFVEETAEGVLVQGITGAVGRRQLEQLRAWGTPIVAGVTPGRGGESVDGVPVYDTVAQAREATGARASIAFLPPAAVREGIIEAAAAGIRLLVCATEGVPVHDEVAALNYARTRGMRVIGPNTSGILIPNVVKMGFMPSDAVRLGRVAVVSRSGTLSYEVVHVLNRAGVGLSAWIGLGGDRVKGTTFAEIIPDLARDGRTEGLVMIGEIGGTDEESAAAVIADIGLPAVAIIAGRNAPAGVALGHAGAMITADRGSFGSKRSALEAAGVLVARTPRDIVEWAVGRGLDNNRSIVRDEVPA